MTFTNQVRVHAIIALLSVAGAVISLGVLLLTLTTTQWALLVVGGAFAVSARMFD